MTQPRQVLVTLSQDIEKWLTSKLESGAYSDESAVIQAELAKRDHSFEDWIQSEVIPAIREYEADPSIALSGEQARAYMETQISKW